MGRPTLAGRRPWGAPTLQNPSRGRRWKLQWQNRWQRSARPARGRQWIGPRPPLPQSTSSRLWRVAPGTLWWRWRSRRGAQPQPRRDKPPSVRHEATEPPAACHPQEAGTRAGLAGDDWVVSLVHGEEGIAATGWRKPGAEINISVKGTVGGSRLPEEKGRGAGARGAAGNVCSYTGWGSVHQDVGESSAVTSYPSLGPRERTRQRLRTEAVRARPGLRLTAPIALWRADDVREISGGALLTRPAPARANA